MPFAEDSMSRTCTRLHSLKNHFQHVQPTPDLGLSQRRRDLVFRLRLAPRVHVVAPHRAGARRVPPTRRGLLVSWRSSGLCLHYPLPLCGLPSRTRRCPKQVGLALLLASVTFCYAKREKNRKAGAPAAQNSTSPARERHGNVANGLYPQSVVALAASEC